MAPLCLLTVHAHPDDESSKGAATVAKYHDEGVRTVLVTATGGEEGEILNPAMDQPGIRERIGEVRRAELAAATAIIGYDEVVLLGYRDSGMPDSPANADPASFARADLDEAVGRLVEVIRRERPQVVVTYPQEQSGYPHPDHLRVNEISELAFDAAGDPAAYPGHGEAWQPSKLYYVVWSAARMLGLHAKYLELGLESPFGEERMARWADVPEPTTAIDVRGRMHITRDALIAHATQIDPNSGWFFGLPHEVADEVHPFEEYILARDLTGRPALEGVEDDLFAGLRP